MHIKKLIIEGFKSYKNRTELDLSENVNLVVGRNGSGKSNIFEAIQFVLSEKYSSMRREVRQRLLHEGAAMPSEGSVSSLITAAYVELVFDNADGRFPIDKNEVTIRRVVGMKKDEYLLNNKHVTRQDVDNLLESAGISRSNPYNMVQQGRVSGVLKMKPSERLELCKDIAGTRVYEARRGESLNILKDASTRRERIEEIVKSITESLNVLEEEKTELEIFQKLDREKRAIEYTLFEAENRMVAEKLQELDDRRNFTSSSSQEFFKQLSKIQDEKSEIEIALSQLNQNLELISKQTEASRSQHQKLVKKNSALECSLSDLEAKFEEEKQMIETQKSELIALEDEIRSIEARVLQVVPQYESIIKEENQLSEDLLMSKQRLNELYAKQSRKIQFRTKKERDSFLKSELAKRKTSLKEDETLLNRLKTDISDLEDEITSIEQVVDGKFSEVNALQEKWQVLGHEEQKLVSERNEKIEMRRQLWKAAKEHDESKEQAIRNLEETRRSFHASMNKNLRKALETIDKLIQEKRINGVYGPIIQLIEHYEGFEKFYKCVETTAGNRLFHVVVDNDDIAAQLIEFLLQNNLGRVTLIPLNRVRARDVEYPSSKDAFPMIERLKFDEKFCPAFMQIFGSTMIVRDIQTGLTLSKSHDLDCITLDGDQVNRKGALSGGFVDSRNSRIKVYRKIADAQKSLQEIAGVSSDKNDEAHRLDQVITQLQNKIQKLFAERRDARNLHDKQKDEYDSLQRNLQNIRSSLQQKKSSIHQVQMNFDLSKSSIESLNEELNSDFNDELNAKEINELDTINSKITDLSERLILISKEKTLRESEKTSFEELLIKSLIPRRRKLLRDISSLNHEDLLEKINQVKQDLSISKLLLEESEDSSAKTGDRYEEISESIRELQNNFEDLKKKEDSLREQIRGESNSINKILNNRSILLQKKEKCVKNIRELGSIPSNALQLCKGKSDDVLLQELDKINEQLKKFSHVNKKAFEQFLQSSEQQKTLLDKLNEVDSGKGSIEDLIQHLDLKKDEAIRTTFKSIAKNFSIVFSELVPGGKAQLVIQKSGNHANEGEASDEEDVESERVDEKVEVDEDDTEEGKENSSKAYAEQYVGINFRVAFPGSREVVSMNQLSGGQQTVVALSLIFAIQRCDPSPFYLFDEIDSNLDAVYRTAVANMISKQSEEGIQFICTTFRSEITQVADKCFGVVYENKVSRVDEISSDDARNIIFEVEREVEQ